MIRGVGGSMVRVTSYAFPVDVSFPQIVHSLPQQLYQKPPKHEMEAEDMVTLHYILQTRIASIHTVRDVVAWDASWTYALQVHYRQGDGSFVDLRLLGFEAEEPYLILRSEPYSLATLGRYHLWAATLAKWTGKYVELVEL